MDVSAALPTFVITLREGVEAALVVGIVLAYLRQADRPELTRFVWFGVACGLLASGLVGYGFYRLMTGVAIASRPESGVLKELLEAGFGLIAIVLLSWMLVWMTQQAKGLKGEIEATMSQVLTQSQGAAAGIFALIAIAVLREGFETVVFITAQFQAGVMPVVGAIAGLVGAVVIGMLLFRLGIRINLRQFFQVMGVLLLLIVAGLVIGVLHHLEGAAIAATALAAPTWLTCSPEQASCLLGAQVWDLAAILPDRQFPGVILKALLGYRDHLYVLQVIGYTVFLTVMGGLYFRSLGGVRSSAGRPE